MAVVEVDSRFPRSLRGAVKIARALVAFVTFVCFAGSRSPGACTALAAMEVLITALFFLLYLLKLDKKMSWLFWPLAVSIGWPLNRRDSTRFAIACSERLSSVRDIFNSVVAALFLLIVCLFATIINTNGGTLAGGVFGLGLLVLCVVDAVLLFQKISLGGPRGRNTPAK
ncbi:chemokine-like factor [Phalacrocorax carbo]|uniref:chemokine-like factor n=1 Tax=Phalacrocorax carbo TaxID=9209 RepID=UPI00311A3D73